MSRITVCVPSFDRVLSLPDCLESVLSQDVEDWELIVADDLSADGSDEIVRAYTGCTPNVHTIVRKQALGYSRNVNAMLESSDADYVAVLSPKDSYLRSDFLSRAVEVMDADPEVAFYHAAYTELDESGNQRRTVCQLDLPGTQSGLDVRRAILRFRLPQMSTVVVRRSLIERAGMLPVDFQRATEIGWLFALAGFGSVHFDPEPRVGSPLEGTRGSLPMDDASVLARRRDVLRVVRAYCEDTQDLRVAWENARQLLESPVPFAAKSEGQRKLELFLAEGEELDRRVVVFGTGMGVRELFGTMKLEGKLAGFIEPDPAHQGESLFGLPIMGTDELLDCGVDAVVVPVLDGHVEVEAWVRKHLPETVAIHRAWE